MRIHRQIKHAGLAAIKQREGLRLRAYQDQADIWTIGYGHTGTVKRNDRISQIQATAYLKEDVHWAESVISASVQVPLNDDEFAALVSWAFNVGTHAVIESTLVRRLNAGDYASAASELMRWVKVTSPKTGKLVFNSGLQNRRISEVEQFTKGGARETRASIARGASVAATPAGREDIAGSRTMRGAGVAGIGTVAGSVIEMVEQAKPQVAEAMWFLPAAKWVFIALVLIGIAAVIYARLDDHKKGES